MEIKKSPKADLENKRGLFLEIGLVVALVLVIGAFAVTPKEHRIEKVDLGYAPVEVEIVEMKNVFRRSLNSLVVTVKLLSVVGVCG